MQSSHLKIKAIIVNLIPILIMIGLIPLVKSDYFLALLYVLISSISFVIKYEKRENIFYLFGFFGMIIAEYIFISTGVETFNRNSLLGLMPIWLPFLWGYSFIVMKRAINILEK